MRAGQGETYTEQVAQRDVLDRAKITEAIVHLLTRRTDTEPFALGLFGHWGSGKSSQIRFVAAALKKAGSARFRVVIFNAWEHEHCENMGAALAQAVVDHFVDGMALTERVGLARRLVVLRNRRITSAATQDVGWLRNAFIRFTHAAAPWFAPVIILMGAGYIVWEQGWFRFDGSVTAALGALGALWATAQVYAAANLTNWFKNLNAENVRKVFWLPDLSARLGSFHEIHLALKQLCASCLRRGAAQEGDYLLLVVDDLDRCSPHVVKQVFDAVRLVANIPRVVTLVALDERIAFSAVEKHFAQFDGSGREPGQVARDYLAKVFQVAVSLQPASKEVSKGFIRSWLFAKPPPDEDERDIQTPPEPKPNPPEDHWREVLPEEIDEFIACAGSFGMVNPRQLWRLKQAWYLLRGLVLTDGADIEVRRPWMRSLFFREWILQSSAQLRTQVESAIRNDAPFDSAWKLSAPLEQRLEEQRLGWAGTWPVVDTFLLPASAGSGKPDA